jgi:formylglycine-generating enzyme required for sulfatase activity
MIKRKVSSGLHVRTFRFLRLSCALFLSGFLLLSCARHAAIPVDETVVPGGSLTVGDDAFCARYEATVGDLAVSRYEITWSQFASAMNYALSHKMAEVRDGKIYPRKGLFPQYASFVFDLAARPDRVALRSGALEVVGQSARMPLTDIGWYGAAFFCNALSAANGLSLAYDWDSWQVLPSARGYRMPTFEEWEYLAKGGAKASGFPYAGSNDFAEVAWFAANSGNAPHEVGGLKPNELGLYDMSGNVSEFCTETYRPIITAERTKDLALKTSNRIWRGGSFKSAPVTTAYFYQNINNPEYYFPFADVGVRTVRAR